MVPSMNGASSNRSVTATSKVLNPMAIEPATIRHINKGNNV